MFAGLNRYEATPTLTNSGEIAIFNFSVLLHKLCNLFYTHTECKGNIFRKSQGHNLIILINKGIWRRWLICSFGALYTFPFIR